MPIPYVPDIKPYIETDQKASTDLLLASIALEELGLAHIIRAEAEKIQFVLGCLDEDNGNETPSLEEILETNKSVEQVMRKAINKEMLLGFKLEDVIELAKRKDKEPIMPESIELDYEFAEIYLDETHQLTATVLPPSSTHKKVTWSSGNAYIAEVTTGGLVIPVLPGSAAITATTVNGLTASCLVTVKPIAPSSITLDIAEIRLNPAETRQLTETVLPADARDKSVTWASSNPSVAAVSGSGLVKAVAPSESAAVITATTVNGLTASCVVYVSTIEMLFDELKEVLDSGYASGMIHSKNTYDKLVSTLDNAKNQYEKGHYENAVKQLENMIELLHDESGKSVEASFADKVIKLIEELVARLRG